MKWKLGRASTRTPVDLVSLPLWLTVPDEPCVNPQGFPRSLNLLSGTFARFAGPRTMLTEGTAARRQSRCQWKLRQRPSLSFIWLTGRLTKD